MFFANRSEDVLGVPRERDGASLQLSGKRVGRAYPPEQFAYLVARRAHLRRRKQSPAQPPQGGAQHLHVESIRAYSMSRRDRPTDFEHWRRRSSPASSRSPQASGAGASRRLSCFDSKQSRPLESSPCRRMRVLSAVRRRSGPRLLARGWGSACRRSACDASTSQTSQAVPFESVNRRCGISW